MNTRLKNMGQWLVLFLESIIFLVIPSQIVLPYSTKFLMDTRSIKLKRLRISERQAISNHVIITGFASMVALFAFGLGLFGKYSPSDIYAKDGDNPMSIILNRRKKNKCCICLEKFKLDDIVRVLECKHCYHKECLNIWLQEHHTCPICRIVIK